MAEIKRYPFFRHLRSESSSYVMQYRKGRLRRCGRGLAFWFRPLTTSVAEVPTDDQEVPLLFHGHSGEFQEVTVQGVVNYRVAEPETLVERIDFTLELHDGRHRGEPLEQIGQLVSGLAQQVALEHMAALPTRELITGSLEPLRARILAKLNGDGGIAEFGIEASSVRLAAIRPTPELERALQTPTLEAIHAEADEATFQRRAMAVEKERAIEENELQNRIELERQREQLIAQEGQNNRHEAEEQAQAAKIEALSMAERVRLEAAARAERISLIEGAKAEAERAHVELHRDLPTQVLVGLAAQELAGKLEHIDHVHISPELLGPLLTDLVSKASARLEE